MSARLDALANSIVYICLLWKISLLNDGIMSITKQTTNSQKTCQRKSQEKPATIFNTQEFAEYSMTVIILMQPFKRENNHHC